jgi:hypothetical protein
MVNAVTHSSKKTIRNKCDTAWAELIKIKAGGRCEVCGTPTTKKAIKNKCYSLNSHHVVGRGNLNLRWDIRNGACLCVRHHKFGIYSAHENPIWFINWFKTHRPEDYEYLQNPEFNKFKTWYISDYEKILFELEKELGKLKEDL